jgi:hypothetical protein
MRAIYCGVWIGVVPEFVYNGTWDMGQETNIAPVLESYCDRKLQWIVPERALEVGP